MFSRGRGLCVVRDFLDRCTCKRLLESVNRCRRKESIPIIYRPADDRPLRYSVLDGNLISRDLPEIMDLYRSVTMFVKTLDRDVEPLQDVRVACNVNITPRGGTYRYHYDRNAVTAILYLNEIEGGETECYPNFRLDLRTTNHPELQQRLDRLLQTRVLRRLSLKETVVRPEAGKLLVMRGNRCLHSVLPVRGERERVNIVMAFDYPNGKCSVADELNKYLYEATTVQLADPNYG